MLFRSPPEDSMMPPRGLTQCPVSTLNQRHVALADIPQASGVWGTEQSEEKSLLASLHTWGN